MIQVFPIPGGAAVYSPEFGVATFRGPDAFDQAEKLALSWMARPYQKTIPVLPSIPADAARDSPLQENTPTPDDA